jgi:arylsulfatase A-like enzyme
MPLKEYGPKSRFTGKLGLTVDESEPAWPAPRRARPGAANVVFIVLDDVGFAQLSCYGGLIATPHLDRLANNGLLYTNMHTTALCSPSRSCILTGRNHHANAMAGITEVSTGYPGYNGNIPFENGFLSEMLLAAGYNTYAVGKWHLTPAEQLSAAGPYDRWPLGRGFERYYGFLGGDTHQYYPELVEDNHQVAPPASPEQGYHLTEDLADRAIAYIADAKQVAPDKPFFLYFSTGAGHAPHHVPKEWADRYLGAFDMGWERAREVIFERQKELGIMPADAVLSPHDPDVPRWDSLSDGERRVAARMMEVYAGFISHTDHHIGRLFEQLDRLGQLDDTLAMVVSDNGASPEGGPSGSVNEARFFNLVPESMEDNLAALDELGGPKYFNHYPWGWTWAGNTPFRRWKRETFRGGVSDPFIVHWPSGIAAKGALRTQYAHIIDMVPTVLDALGQEPPEAIRGISQAPLHGVSLRPTFDDGAAPSERPTQYFEMLGHRSIYHDGWRAVCPWPGSSFSEGRPFGTPITSEDLRLLDAHGWQLYHVARDPTESEDVAGRHPERVRELISLWYVEAGRYNVLPIDGSAQQRLAAPRPQIAGERDQYVYFAGTQSIPENSAVHLLNRSFVIRAELVVPANGADGVLLTHGGLPGGYSFYVKDGTLRYAYNYVGERTFHVMSAKRLPQGPNTVRCEFKRTGEPSVREGRGASGTVRLFVGDEEVGKGEIPVTAPITLAFGGGLVCGRSGRSPVTDDYTGEFPFTGTLERVTVEVGREALTRDAEAEMRVAMARQ